MKIKEVRQTKSRLSALRVHLNNSVSIMAFQWTRFTSSYYRSSL